MIPYVEIIKKDTLKKIALIEPSDCWFELSFFDWGEFELYCVASQANISNLQKGNYVKLPNEPYVWVITSLNYTYVEGVPMISAKGYSAKWLLHKRVIQAPIGLPSQVALAVEQLVYNNLGSGAAAARQVAGFTVYTSGITTTLVETQAARANLGDFINELLKSYNLGSIVIYENETLIFKVIQGQDVSASVRLSQSLDNLLESAYNTDDNNLATNALVVSTVDDVDYVQTADDGATGVDRAEVLISSNISTEYTPNGATDPVKLDLTNATDLALYKSWLAQEGYTQLANYIVTNELSSKLGLINSNYEFENDYNVGDIVGVQDEYFNILATARITKITIKQDAEGYGIEAEYSTLTPVAPAL